ncbi:MULTISPECIES: hypothetical protein [unclassified Yoonia]|uniref:hypothetical protein n=1 Tax=unclassified Yoonia TaxID=2629118 RepID=UPI002AFE7EA0|nr:MULTISPECIES: hypothetical protein [unclassified Yoonia]
MTFPAKFFGACAAAALLAACGGGGGGGPQTEFTSQQLDSRVPGESDIAAVGLLVDTDGNPTDTSVAFGKLDRVARTLTIGNVVVTGNPNNTVWDGDDYRVERIPGFPNRAFLIPVTIADKITATNPDGGYETQYIIGVVSRTQDLPTGGTVIFDGTARIGGILAEPSRIIDANGVMTLTARFAGDRGVDVNLTGLSTGIFNRLEISNLEIVNSNGSATFQDSSATTIRYLNGNTVVSSPIAGTVEQFVDGAFYGGLPNVIGPIEVGGVFTIVGTDQNGNTVGNIYGIFEGLRRQTTP